MQCARLFRLTAVCSSNSSSTAHIFKSTAQIHALARVCHGTSKVARLLKFVWHVRDLHRERLFVRIMSALADVIIANSEAIVQPSEADVSANKDNVVCNGITLADDIAELTTTVSHRSWTSGGGQI